MHIPQFIALFGIALKDHPVPPKDISTYTKENCQKCLQEMWVFKKKKELYVLVVEKHKTTVLYCYDCFIKTAKEKTESGEWDLDNLRSTII